MKTRWRLIGQLTTDSPMHIGTGDVLDRSPIEGKDGAPCDIQAIVKGRDGRPCIPGTALKGVLRSWAEAMLKTSEHQSAIDRIFGKRDIKDASAQSGWAEFCTAHAQSRKDQAVCEKYVPYWIKESETGIVSHVCINRTTGAASDAKLFFEEFVPEATTFDVEIDATRLSENDIALLLAILELGSSHKTHPFQFGANGADGWGRMKWKFGTLLRCDAPIPLKANQVGFDCCQQTVASPAVQLDVTLPSHISLELTLKCDGPFLVNDTSRTHKTENDDLPNFVPLRRANGGVWLPASSFRGALRERAEFLLRSLDETATGDPNDKLADGPIERIFGQNSQASVLTIEEFTEVGRCEQKHQDFVAIDRWTGGAADGAKFDAQYADRPEVATRVTLDTHKLRPFEFALLSLAIRDLCDGKVALGWGNSKGYGNVTGAVAGITGQMPSDWKLNGTEWTIPPNPKTVEWLQLQLQAFAESHPVPQPQSDKPVPVETPPVKPKPVILEQGVLTWVGSGSKSRPSLKSAKGAVFTPRQGTLHQTISSPSPQPIDVDYEAQAGQPTKIRLKGQPWEAPTQQAEAAPQESRFAHPYYFLHLKDRFEFKDHKDLGDLRPDKQIHSRYIEDRFSGTLKVRLTTATPLLLCDEGKDTEIDGHRSYGVRLQNGLPHMASSSVRGVLRTAFEAITNSRFGVFPFKEPVGKDPAEKHSRRFGFRLPAKQGIAVVPIRIVDDPTSSTGLAADLLLGDTKENTSLPAAWLGRYGWAPAGTKALTHRQEVWAYLTPWHYHKVNERTGRTTEFNFWNVEEVDTGPTCPSTKPGVKRPKWSHASPDSSWGKPGWYKGYVCINNQNMGGKHDERVFFSASAAPHVELDQSHVRQWWQLIEDYQVQHERELEQGATRPSILKAPNVFSRHISALPKKVAKQERQLKSGDLAYAEVERSGTGWKIKALYPVMISRKLYEASPLDLLPVSLRPATNQDQFSPADRVFGWVSQDESTGIDPAFRSPIRVGPVQFIGDAEKHVVECGKPLAILGQPKPQQGRFYLGQADGTAQPLELDKEQSGFPGRPQKDGTRNRIRGPKVYPHHQSGVGADAFASPRDRSNQNRTIEKYVDKGATFEFDLHVTNLTEFELGALVWLLTLSDKQFLRMGLGKPLGFGSVRAEIVRDQSTIASGAAWIAALARADRSPISDGLDRFKQAFKTTIDTAHPKLLASFLRVAEGFADVPVHYPVLPRDLAKEGKIYEWFVLNDDQRNGSQFALPDILSTQPLLPLNPSKPAPQNRGPQRR